MKVENGTLTIPGLTITKVIEPGDPNLVYFQDDMYLVEVHASTEIVAMAIEQELISLHSLMIKQTIEFLGRNEVKP